MFGDRLMKRAFYDLTKEGAEQWDTTTKEIVKLVELSGKGWRLISTELFDKVRVRCFIEGAATFAVGTIIGKAYLAFKESKKQDTTESEEGK